MKLFLIYSIIGWLLEIIYISLANKKLINNHFMFLPFCPMYGLGGLLIDITIKNINNIFLIFIISIIISLSIEYLTSYIMEKLYHHRWWDYNNKKFNINGRICLHHAIEFGLLGITIKYISNYLTNLYIFNNTIFIISIIFIIDLIISTIYTYIITNKYKYKNNYLTNIIKNKLKNIS